MPRDPSLRFDYAAAALGLWFIGGLYLDGWAHTHKAELETFFTPWHAVLYGGFFALAGFLVAATVIGRRQGRPWSGSAPEGYGLSLVGAGVFVGAGVADMLWHTFLGIEVSVEALVSPPHLALATGGALLGIGPLRAAFARRDRASPGLRALLPALVSAGDLLSGFTFFTQVFHPFVRPWAATWNEPTDETFHLADPRPELPGMPDGIPAVDVAHFAGLASIIVQTAFAVGVVLVVARRWRLPVGSVAIVLGLNAALLAAMRGQWFVVPVAVAAGFAADGLLHAWRVTPQEPRRLRHVAAALPAILYAFYFGALLAGPGIWWSWHLVSGAVVLAGLTGFLVAVAAAPSGA